MAEWGGGIKRSGISSHLEKGGAGHAKEVHSYREFPEEFSGNVTQPGPLQPVQDKVQVRSDLDRSGPLIERSTLTCGEEYERQWVCGPGPPTSQILPILQFGIWSLLSRVPKHKAGSWGVVSDLMGLRGSRAFLATPSPV